MRYLVLGASLRGLDHAASIAVSEGAEVVLYDSEHTVDAPAGEGISVVDREWSPSVLDGVDRIITSPWFPETSGPIADALERGIDVVTEAGFGLERIDTPTIAITGTNGKTTVTETVTAMLTASGVDAIACGNVGAPVSAMTQSNADILVVELSSYQLRFMEPRAHRCAAFLNLAPDHLDWHGSFAGYAAAKSRIFAGMGPDGVVAYNVDDAAVRDAVALAKCALVPCSGHHVPEGGNGVASSRLSVDGFEFATGVEDPAYRFDLVISGTIALRCGATPEAVANVIDRFTYGEHRRRVVAVINDVQWVNDSKATNPHAARTAAAAYDRVVLLAGGQNKGLDLSGLADVASVKAVIAFGEAAEEIAASASRETIVTGSLADAVAKANEIAVPGDTVLLSPGCASFDEFTSYADRGAAFERLVGRMEG